MLINLYWKETWNLQESSHFSHKFIIYYSKKKACKHSKIPYLKNPFDMDIDGKIKDKSENVQSTPNFGSVSIQTEK